MSDSDSQLPRPALLSGLLLLGVGFFLVVAAFGLYVWDQSRAVPSGDQSQARLLSGTLTNITAPDKAKPGYHIVITESSVKMLKREFVVSKYMYDTLSDATVAGGQIQRNSIQASYNPKTTALYSIKVLYPQRETPIYNTDQDVYANIPFLIVGGFVGALMLVFGIFFTIRTYLDRIAAPVTVMADVNRIHTEKDAVLLKVVPINDLYNKGKPFDIYISHAQFAAIGHATHVEVSLSPALRHIYAIRNHSSFIA